MRGLSDFTYVSNAATRPRTNSRALPSFFLKLWTRILRGDSAWSCVDTLDTISWDPEAA